MDSPSCIDLMLTNKSLSFQHTSTIETGLSDFHKLTTTTMKSTFYKQEPKIIHYRNYKHFNNDIFQSQLYHEMNNRGINCINCDEFESLFISTLDKHAPNKIRYIRANNSAFMNKSLCKAIMVRSRLRNRFLRLKTKEAKDAYKI